MFNIVGDDKRDRPIRQLAVHQAIETYETKCADSQTADKVKLSAFYEYFRPHHLSTFLNLIL